MGSPCHRPEWSAFKGLGCLGSCPENTPGTLLGFGVLLQDRPCCEEAKSEKTEGSWGCLELSPVCTDADLERVPEMTQAANPLRNEREFSGKPQKEVARAGVCLGSAWLPKEFN